MRFVAWWWGSLWSLPFQALEYAFLYRRGDHGRGPISHWVSQYLFVRAMGPYLKRRLEERSFARAIFGLPQYQGGMEK